MQAEARGKKIVYSFLALEGFCPSCLLITPGEDAVVVGRGYAGDCCMLSGVWHLWLAPGREESTKCEMGQENEIPSEVQHQSLTVVCVE